MGASLTLGSSYPVASAYLLSRVPRLIPGVFEMARDRPFEFPSSVIGGAAATSYTGVQPGLRRMFPRGKS